MIYGSKSTKKVEEICICINSQRGSKINVFVYNMDSFICLHARISMNFHIYTPPRIVGVKDGVNIPTNKQTVIHSDSQSVGVNVSLGSKSKLILYSFFV